MRLPVYLSAGMALATLSSAAFGDAVSVGFAGIDAVGLRDPGGTLLTGAGVNIGQVEQGRVPLRGVDSDANSNGFVVPTQTVTLNGQLPIANSDLDIGHPLQVASVMIGASGAPRSVAPEASLYSSGYITTGGSPSYPDSLISTQYIAKRFPFNNPQHIRVINHSWYKLQPDLQPVDGNSLLTLGMDWMASEFDVLNVFAGTQDGAQQRVPSDNYNGITVARSELMNGVFQKVEAGNDNEGDDDAEGDRVSVDLMAPGVNITVADAGASNPTATVFGTSFAAPHVTGTVALLNEYGDYQVTHSGSARWDSDNTRKHEVMKAVLLNSADKIAGANGSGREVVDENDNNWEQSPAFMNDQISLDQQMGAGHLNARRAATQFSTGEYNNGENVPMLGWDYGETGGLGTTLSYPLAENFAGGYVTVTLAWDRGVIKSGGLDDTYDSSNMFTGQFVDDLDLFICPVGWTTPMQTLLRSRFPQKTTLSISSSR